MLDLAPAKSAYPAVRRITPQPMARRLHTRLPAAAEAVSGLMRPDAHPLGAGWRQVTVQLADLDHVLQGHDLTPLTPELGACVRRRQLTFLAGRLCAEAAMASAGGAAAWVARGLAGQPVWPVGWCGSISHNEDRALAIVAPQDQQWSVGVDVETIVTGDARTAVESVCLTARELASLALSTAPGIAATLRFSAKEAYYKALYPHHGRHVDFLEVEVAHSDGLQGVFQIGPAAAGETCRPTLPLARGHYAVRDTQLITWVCLSLPVFLKQGYDDHPQH